MDAFSESLTGVKLNGALFFNAIFRLDGGCRHAMAADLRQATDSVHRRCT